MKNFNWSWLWFLGVIILWAFSWWWIANHFCSLEQRGQFGDMFGAINALFSGLAFAGVIYTLYIQKEDTQKQNDLLIKQNFESTFFQLLQSQLELIKMIDLRESGNIKNVIAQGRDCFKTFYNDLEKQINTAAVQVRLLTGKVESDSIAFVVVNYMDVYNTHQGDLAHYFRSLYNIIRFVHEAEEVEDKMKYIRLVRAQLSAYEIIILFYNGLSPNGVEKFKPLIETYHLFQNINAELLLPPAHLKGNYEPSAFS